MATARAHTTEDGKSRIQLRANDHTVWLSQRDMAHLFDLSTDNMGVHLKNIYEDGDLDRGATTEDTSVVQREGGREVQRQVTLTDAHIEKIVTTYQHHREEDCYAKRISMARIAEEGYNLNISRYISTAVGEEEIDLVANHQKLIEIESRCDEGKKNNVFLAELGPPPLP